MRKGAQTRYRAPIMSVQVRTLAAVLAAAVLAAGCGSHSEPQVATTPRPVVRPKATSPQDAAMRNMVAAVSMGKGVSTPPVQLKFELKDRPAVAQPLEISVVILPGTNLDRVYGRVEGEDGLQLLEGSQIPTTDKPAEGVPINHSIKVVPQRDGIFAVHATLTVEAAGQSSNQSFAIPVIAGSGMPDLPAKAGGPAPAANRVAAAAEAAPAQR